MSLSEAARSLRRTLPPVVPTTSARAIALGLRAAVDGSRARARLRTEVESRFGADRAWLTDSGTSALLLALRMAAEHGPAVALPAYSCPDLLSAAVAAGVRVRLYDVDPRTLSPDLDSVEAALARGVAAVVVAHLFGYAADIIGVADLATAHGALVVEDAAQAAGGTLGGRFLGSFGPLTVLSFGRGKGISGGGGGALLVSRDAGVRGSPVPEHDFESADGPAGWSALGATAAQWVFARPRLYGIPSAIPWLRLGETIYHPAHDPQPIAAVSAALAGEALRRVNEEVRAREAMAARVRGLAGEDGATGVECIDGGRPGYLRLPVRRRSARPAPSLGILRGYPATLADYDAARHVLEPGETAGRGAVELRDSLFTLPTHHHISVADTARIADWLVRGSRDEDG